MTDRIKGLTVLLEDEMREDDCEPLIQAIKLLKGVKAVGANVSNPDHWLAVESARLDVTGKVLDALKPVRGKRLND